MNGLGIIVGNHRYWTHKSFEFKYSWIKYLCGIFSVISGTGSTIGWVGIHRNHHGKVDSINDPHSPAYLNLFLPTSVHFLKRSLEDILYLKNNISNKFK